MFLYITSSATNLLYLWIPTTYICVYRDTSDTIDQFAQPGVCLVPMDDILCSCRPISKGEIPYWTKAKFSYISVHVWIFFFYFYCFAHDSLFPVTLTCQSFAFHGVHVSTALPSVPSGCRLLYPPVLDVLSMLVEPDIFWAPCFSNVNFATFTLHFIHRTLLLGLGNPIFHVN